MKPSKLRLGKLGLLITCLLLTGCGQKNGAMGMNDDAQLEVEATVECMTGPSDEELLIQLQDDLDNKNHEKIRESYLILKEQIGAEYLVQATEAVSGYYNTLIEAECEGYNQSGQLGELDVFMSEAQTLELEIGEYTEQIGALKQSKDAFAEASAYVGQGKWKEAIDAFDKVIERDKNYALAQEKKQSCIQHHLDRVYEENDQLMSAYQFKEALAVAESVHEIYNNEKSQQILDQVNHSIMDFTRRAYMLFDEYIYSYMDLVEASKIVEAYDALVPNVPETAEYRALIKELEAGQGEDGDFRMELLLTEVEDTGNDLLTAQAIHEFFYGLPNEENISVGSELYNMNVYIEDKYACLEIYGNMMYDCYRTEQNKEYIEKVKDLGARTMGLVGELVWYYEEYRNSDKGQSNYSNVLKKARAKSDELLVCAQEAKELKKMLYKE